MKKSPNAAHVSQSIAPHGTRNSRKSASWQTTSSWRSKELPMTDAVKIYEIGSDEFNAFQKRLNDRAIKRDVSLGGRPSELLARAKDTGDGDFIEFATHFYEGLPHTARATVERVIEMVEQFGDQGVRHCARLFDGEELPTARMAVSKMDLMKGADAV